jgi:tRNA(His) guanylyltransferase
MKKDSLGDRMKTYEGVTKNFLTRRTPVIIRIDGKAFHSFTRGFKKPFDKLLIETMQDTAEYLFRNIQGCKLAYVQSDEISLLLTDYEKITTDAWFGNNVQKMASVSASMATMMFNKSFSNNVWDYQGSVTGWIGDDYDFSKEADEKLCKTYRDKVGMAMFDSRVFSLPKEEVCNYFIWRQQDATRNSIQMLAQSEFSHKELQGLSCDKLQDKLMLERNINFNDIETTCKRGSCVKNGEIDNEIPIFTQDRGYIDRLL